LSLHIRTEDKKPEFFYIFENDFHGKTAPEEASSLYPSLKAARRYMGQTATEIFDETSAKTWFIPGSAGVGKTREMLGEGIRRAKKGQCGTVFFTHALTEEAKKLYIEAHTEGAPCVFLEGRGPKTCELWTEIKDAPDMGSVCRACKERAGCRYHLQLKEANDRITEANKLGKGLLVFCPYPSGAELIRRHKVDLLIIDESPMDQILPTHNLDSLDFRRARTRAKDLNWEEGLPLLQILDAARTPDPQRRKGPHGEVNEADLFTLVMQYFHDQYSMTKVCEEWLDGCEVIFKNNNHQTALQGMAVPYAFKKLVAKLADPSLPYSITLYRPMGQGPYNYKITEPANIKAGKIKICILDATGDAEILQKTLGVDIDVRPIEVLATTKVEVENVLYSASARALRSEPQRERILNKPVVDLIAKAERKGWEGYVFFCHKEFEGYWQKEITPLLPKGAECHFVHYYSSRGTNKYRHCQIVVTLGTPRADPANLQSKADLTGTDIALWEEQCCQKELLQCAMRVRPLDGGPRLIVNIGKIPINIPGAKNTINVPGKSQQDGTGLGQGYTSAPMDSIQAMGEQVMNEYIQLTRKELRVWRPSMAHWLEFPPEMIVQDLADIRAGKKPSSVGIKVMNAIYEGGDTAPGKEVRQQEAYKRARAAANKEEINLGGCTVKEYACLPGYPSV